MADRTQLRERYELRDIIGRGGMGVVYRAWDQLMKREVAVKTLLEVDNPLSLNLFFKEWGLLASMVHPNIISIYDIGEFEQEGVKRPFFVMPLLVGSSLEKLIRDGSPKYDTGSMLDIIVQASRGLQAAHDMGLIHRDIKPSNIFVLDDQSVKIIDFGIARLVSAGSQTSLKGTLSYIAPEQLQLKPPTPLADQYSLAVVGYQALTRTLPYRGATDSDVMEAILHHSAAPVSEVNGTVNYAVSQTIHKGMARSSWHRFPNVREFGESLLKAQRGEAISYFDTAQIKPRLQKAIENFERGEYEFAADILAELEGEGHLDQQIVLVRRQVEQAVRQKRLRVLLDNARRFQEAQEYSVALRKVQEALDLDPNDTDSLALKSVIEKDRREKKIVEWNQIARQHLANESFQQAREALSNILRAKPHDADALQMMAEVTRGEQELERHREQKTQLYSQAMQAWERGEVTSALSKLDVLAALERNRPDTDSGMSAIFEGFYNQVRSEHDLLKNQYAEARRLLAEDDFATTNSLCRQMLAKYPNHALFQALDYDIRERQSQKLSSYIAEIDRRLEKEPDLDRRVALLDEALRNYPGDKHFEQALRLVREKRDLVTSIVVKGRYFEEQHQFNEALDQWQIVRSIHAEYPGLAFELERLGKRRDQHALESAKATWIEQVERNLQAGDYALAAGSVKSALAEFPDDAQLMELGRLARNSGERGAKAAELVSRAQVHLEANLTAEALPLLREATTLDPRSSAAQAMLVNTLVEQARLLVDSDADGASAMVDEVLALQPNHPAAVSVAAQLKHVRNEEELSCCLAEARRLQADGDADGALAIVGPFLQKYPADNRLLQLRASLERSRAEKLKVDSVLQTRTVPVARPSAPPKTAVPRTPPVPVAPAPPPTPPPAVQATPKLHREWRVGLISGVGVATLLAAVGLWRFSGKSAVPPPMKTPPAISQAALVSVNLSVSPEAAEIRVDGKPCGVARCQVMLSAGPHELEAVLAGYFPSQQKVQVPAAGMDFPPIHLNLTAATPVIAISTNLNDAQVSFDNAPPNKIAGAELTLKDIADGSHSLRLFGGASEALVNVKFSAGEAPQLALPMLTRAYGVAVVASQGTSAKVYYSAPNTKAALDGQPLVDVPVTGLALTGLAPGRHELAMEVPGYGAQRVLFECSPAPTLSVAATADLAVGGLRLAVNVDGATVFLNNAPIGLRPQRGLLLLYLLPKSYSVRVERSGFITPPEQTVELKRGQEAKLQFQLLPAAKTAMLMLRNGTPSSEVLVDGRQVGVIGTDGKFSGLVDVGRHRVDISKSGYRTLSSEQDFAAGKTVELTAMLAGAIGTLRIAVQPPNVKPQMDLRRENELPRRLSGETSLELPEGTYSLLGSAPGFRSYSATVVVKAGQVVTATLNMEAQPTAVVPRPVTGTTLTDWDRTGGWDRDASGLRRQGGEWIFLPNSVGANIRFRALLEKGKGLEWSLVRDVDNRVDFRMEKGQLERQETLAGKRAPRVRVPIALKLDEPFEVQMRLVSGAVETTIQGTGSRAADSLSNPSVNYATGRFGFHVPRRDVLRLSDFSMK